MRLSSDGGKGLVSHNASEMGDFPSLSSSSQKALITAMQEPSSYPKGVSEVGHKETHISHLFFVGDLVYKIKKPVLFSFLDFSTLAKRKFFLQEELRLNRRLAPSVYLGVLPISHENECWQLGSDVRPVEYTLVMRRLPESRMLDFLVERDQGTREMMRSLAEYLAPFHTQAATGGRINNVGNPLSVRNLWDENLADIRPYVGRLLDSESFKALKDFGPCFITGHKDLFVRRVLEGRIRELHGDLHCEHICFPPEGIQIFDCIEFSPRLRYCDVASEIAFLVMDLEFRGAKDLAQDFLARYKELADDDEFPLLLPFYKCHRALVRGKVAALRSGGTSPQASAYFAYACRVRWEACQPFLLLISGLTGSGKSTLAQEMSHRLGMRIINSDATRKALAGNLKRQVAVPYAEGIYSPSKTRQTYAKMAEEAGRFILKGEGAILDATFHQKFQRETILHLASKHQIPVAMIHCYSSDEVVRERLKRRAEEGSDLSDGRWEIYLKQGAVFEPFEEVPPNNYLSLNTEADISALGKKVEQFLQRLFSCKEGIS
jgi:aminoglycoside phosphotransferase family enzyme/predicted kinase